MNDMHIVREVIQQPAAGMQQTYWGLRAVYAYGSAVAAGIVIKAAKSGSATVAMPCHWCQSLIYTADRHQ